MAKILIVEDDLSLASMICDWLRFEHHLVEPVDNGDNALELMRSYTYDVVILDWAIPGLSGIEVCQQFRAMGGTTPILLLTGKGAIEDKEVGFNSGADDYLTKPFQAKELSMRVRALLRRSTAVTSDVLKAGNITLNAKDYRVTKNETQLQLAPREFALLEFFMRHPNEVFSPEALLDRVWASDSEASRDTVRVCITRLRHKLGTDSGTPLIQTVFGVGYKLELPG